MNIFYLSEYADEAAEMHCDKHVVKMILETAQLLSTAHRVLDGDDYADRAGLYKVTHINHPSAVWVRQSEANYYWTLHLLWYLCAEYSKRYHKVHKTVRLIDALAVVPDNIPDGDFTEPPQCMPDEYKNDCAVTAYRTYYKNDKAGFAVWKYTQAPTWWRGVAA